MGRFPWVTAVETYARDIRAVVEPSTNRERRAKLLYIGSRLHDGRESGTVGTTNPSKVGKREIDFLAEWMRSEQFPPAYQQKLWGYVRLFLRHHGNPILDTLKARSLWKSPPNSRPAIRTKDELWYKDTLQRLEGVDGWPGSVIRFAVAFYFGTGVRAGELRKADLGDLDTVAWRFRVMHPKGANRYGIVGAQVDIYTETRVHVADFLAAREARLKALDLNPAEVQALVPNENGKQYSEGGWRSMRHKQFQRLGIDGDYRILRRTHAQLLIDRLEARDYREGAVIEIGAKRLRNTPEVFRQFYGQLRSRRAEDAARLAWESADEKFSTRPD
jgi:integrase